MLRRCTVLNFAMFLFFSCSQSYLINIDDPAQCRQFSQDVAEMPATIVLQNATGGPLQGSVLAADSLLHVVSGGKTKNLNFAEIRELRIQHAARARWQGLGFGVLIGGISGAAIGFASGDDEDGYFSMSAGDKALAGGLSGVVVGGVAGYVIGRRSGSADIYRFHKQKSLK